MAIEIERKFLLRSTRWQQHPDLSVTHIRQGYLVSDAGRTVRVRWRNGKGYLTVKGKPESGSIARMEYEYEIPGTEAEALLQLCKPPLIEKKRWLLPAGNHTWEIDIFEGENNGLCVAEIELVNEHETFEKPDWLGEEVTHDGRYSNAALSRVPYSQW
ncbi:MAG: CYTH domain-containing protein [Bacteroidetes bacterium]|nr:CYTH domain-containing protein [Bacteroidota bacterium]